MLSKMRGFRAICSKTALQGYGARNGSGTATTGGASSTAFTSLNPATGTRIAAFEDESPDVVQQKFELAVEGQESWAATPLEERKKPLVKFGKLLLENVDILAKLLTSEMGKPITQSRNEIRATVSRLQYFIDNADKVGLPETVHKSGRWTESIIYEPLGVVANISAWNYPYFVASNVFGAALVTGNAVMYKPSEHTPVTGLSIASLLHQAGVPLDVFVPVVGRGETGASLASLPGLGGVFFTGSNATGTKVAELAAKNLVKVQLELGGKDPIYVRSDVDSIASAAASIADGAFYNCGQSCCAVERIYVDKSIYPQFVEAFVATVRSYVVGDPEQENTFIGPVARRQQLDILLHQVSDAVKKGAIAHVTGDLSRVGKEGNHNFFPPTVLSNVDHSMAIMQEESFGPIIGIQAVESDDEALSLMADTKYGLTAGIYCKDQEMAELLLSGLDVGTGYWNCCDRSVPRLPWSGRKGSGLGSTLSMEGMRAMLRPKALHLQAPG